MKAIFSITFCGNYMCLNCPDCGTRLKLGANSRTLYHPSKLRGLFNDDMPLPECKYKGKKFKFPNSIMLKAANELK